MPKSYLESIGLPGGGEYYFRDADAWQEIEDIKEAASSAMHYVGETTTEIADGDTTATLTIDGESKTFTADDAGAVVIYGELEFIWNGTRWKEYGSTGSLKALAFKSSATGSFTPSGSVAAPVFTGTAATISVTGTPAGTISAADDESGNYQPKGSVSAPTFSGTQATISVTGTPTGTISAEDDADGNYQPKGSVSAPTFSGTQATITVTGTPAGSISAADNDNGNYQPKGSVSAPTVSVKTAGTTTTVNSITDVGTLPSLTTEVVGTKLTLSFSQGTLPTKGADTTVKTGDAEYQAAAPTFTGTKAQIDFTGSSLSSTGTYTPAGTNTAPTFTGTKAQIDFTGSELSSTGTYTPAGTNTAPTFTGTKAQIDFTGSALSSTGSYTPEGTNNAPTFTGSAGSVTVS